MLSKIITLLSFLTLGVSSFNIGNININGLNRTDNLGNNITIDYLLVHDGNTRFGGGIEPYYHAFSYQECINECSTNDTCLGIYFGEMENITNIISEMNGSGIEDLNQMCCLFSSLGYPFENQYMGYSYIKTTHFTGINSTLNDYSHSIIGYVNDYGNYNLNIDSSIVYIDLNHNGVLDKNEPNQTVRHNEKFNFSGLNPGNYLLREVVTEGCEQLYPGLTGNNYNYNYYNYFSNHGDGYIDSVQSYFHQGHHTYSMPHGGYVGNNITIDNRNFSFILGNDNSTYMSFYPGYNITLVFIDETIINQDNISENLFFDIYGDSDTRAHLSISHDGVNYYNLSILSSENSSFNTGDVENITTPISHIRLHFFGDDLEEPLNIKRIYGDYNSLYKPEFGYYLHIPIENYYYLYFYNNCNYNSNCYNYCNYNTIDYDNYEACLHGCDLFSYYETCFCNRFNSNDPSGLALYFGDENNFNYNSCNLGCDYNMKKYVYPHYEILVNRTSSTLNIIDSIYYCSDSCVDMLSYSCAQNNLCSGFSVLRNQSGYTYSKITESPDNNSYLIIKSQVINTEVPNTTILPITTPLPTTSLLPEYSISTSSPSTSSSSIQNLPSNIDKNTKNEADTTTRTKDIILYVLLVIFIIILVIIGSAFIKFKFFNKYTNITNRDEGNSNERNVYSYDNPLYNKT